VNLIIVTDIFALPAKADCISEKLPNISSIERIGLNELCEQPNLSGEALHQFLFTDGGLEKAANSLLNIAGKDSFGLGYSAGGTALWRAVTEGLILKGLFCISSTRLRLEKSISTPNHVFFGAKDHGKPTDDWLIEVPQRQTVFKGCRHNFYLDPELPGVAETRRKIASDMHRISSNPELG